MKMKIANETQNRVNAIYNTSPLEVSVENKKVYVLGEIAVLLAGILDTLLLKYEVDDD